MHNKLAKMHAARDAVYVVAIALVATALCTLLGTLGEIGNTLTTFTVCVALGIILVLIYDMGRIVYRVIELRAESVADRLAKMAERSKIGNDVPTHSRCMHAKKTNSKGYMHI
jgi:nitrogen fixation/metabolism regulation signal transduction histidine kinase